MSKPEDFKFDSRVRDRLLRSRVLSSADVQRHVEQLPDLDGQYEVMNDTPQPALAPARSEVHEEPIVFDGIRRLQALADVSAPAPAPRYVPPVAAPVSNSGLPAYREPEPRALGTPLRSSMMDSEISGVGAGAVSAALGAMAAEARNASGFGSSSMAHLSPVVLQVAVTPPVAAAAPAPVVAPAPAFEAEPPTPVTLRSEATPQVSPISSQAAAEEEEEEDEDEDEDDDDTDEDEADDTDQDEVDEDDTDEDDTDEDEDDEDEDEEEEEADASAAGDPEREDLT